MKWNKNVGLLEERGPWGLHKDGEPAGSNHQEGGTDEAAMQQPFIY